MNSQQAKQQADEKRCLKILERLQSTFAKGITLVNTYERFINILIYLASNRAAQLRSYREEEKVGDMRQAAVDIENGKLKEITQELIVAIGDLSKSSDSAHFDAYGKVYELIGSSTSKSSLGQFFTPINLCNLMAEIVNPYSDEPELYAASFADPSCGSGRTVLASIGSYRNKDKQRVVAHLVDIDLMSCKLAALNCMLYNIPALVECRDGLASYEREASSVIFEVGVSENADKEIYPFISQYYSQYNGVEAKIVKQFQKLCAYKGSDTGYRGLMLALHFNEAKSYYYQTGNDILRVFHEKKYGTEMLEIAQMELAKILSLNLMYRNQAAAEEKKAKEAEPISIFASPELEQPIQQPTQVVKEGKPQPKSQQEQPKKTTKITPPPLISPNQTSLF